MAKENLQLDFFQIFLLALGAGLAVGLTTEKIVGFLIACAVIVFYFFYRG